MMMTRYRAGPDGREARSSTVITLLLSILHFLTFDTGRSSAENEALLVVTMFVTVIFFFFCI